MMETFECPKCRKRLLKCNMILHNLHCSSSLASNNQSNILFNDGPIVSDPLSQLNLEKQKLIEELNIEKEKTKQLEIDLNKEKQKNVDLNNKLNSFINTNNELNNKIETLEKDLNSKNIELKDLKNKLNGSSLENCKPGEKIIVAHFISTDQKINYAIACKNTDTFVKIEEELYNEFPEYREENTYFTLGGFLIKRFKTIEQNNIKNHDKLILNVYE